MLTPEKNAYLTRVEGDAPMGQLLRRYWQPVAATAELLDQPTKAVRIFGEELVLFRTLDGEFGLTDRYCAHRGVSLVYGVPEKDGIRCGYHGWKFDTKGNCVEQPFETVVGRGFKDKVKMKSYPVQELGGLVFAYMGPEPAPLLPRWEPLVRENCVRDISITILPCNWLQAQENSVDPVHAEWLHGYYANYLRAFQSGKMAGGTNLAKFLSGRGHVKIGFDRTEYGIVKRRVVEGGSEEDNHWRLGHPMVFPNMNHGGNPVNIDWQWRVPIDDTHTFHVFYSCYFPAPGVTAPKQDVVPYVYAPEVNAKQDRDMYPSTWRDDASLNVVLQQDILAWMSQGPVVRREKENLGASDTGVALLRRLLEEQIDVMNRGEDPMGVIRDPAKNQNITLEREGLDPDDDPTRSSALLPIAAGHTAAKPDIKIVLDSWKDWQEKRQTAKT